jgi:hypothetical protein
MACAAANAAAAGAVLPRGVSMHQGRDDWLVNESVIMDGEDGG